VGAGGVAHLSEEFQASKRVRCAACPAPSSRRAENHSSVWLLPPLISLQSQDKIGRAQSDLVSLLSITPVYPPLNTDICVHQRPPSVQGGFVWSNRIAATPASPSPQGRHGRRPRLPPQPPHHHLLPSPSPVVSAGQSPCGAGGGGALTPSAQAVPRARWGLVSLAPVVVAVADGRRPGGLARGARGDAVVPATRRVFGAGKLGRAG
jgi:hypothetical protein